MTTITQGSLAKLLIQEGFIDLWTEELLMAKQIEVMHAPDDKLVDSRTKYNGAKEFADSLKYLINEKMLKENPDMIKRNVEM